MILKKSINEKKDIINKFDNLFNKYNSFISFNPNSLDSTKLNELKKKLKLFNIFSFSLKKTLMNIFLKKNNIINNLFKLNIIGLNIILFYKDDIIKVIKLINNLIKKNNNKGKINFLYFNKKLYIDKDLEYLSSLLSYNENIIKLIQIIKIISLKRLLFLLRYVIKLNNKG